MLLLLASEGQEVTVSCALWNMADSAPGCSINDAAIIMTIAIACKTYSPWMAWF